MPKFLPVVNRYAGSPSPRWRDALANGAYLLYPQGTFYGEIAPGCYPFRAETMVSDISSHLDRFEACDPAYDLATVVPEVNARFAIHRQPREESYQRLLKYALFMGLVWPHAPAARRRGSGAWSGSRRRSIAACSGPIMFAIGSAILAIISARAIFSTT